MQRPFFSPRLSGLLCASIVLLPISASAQSIKITLPDTTTCTYSTGQVTNNATPGQLQAIATATPVGTGCGSTTSSSNAPVTFGPASPLTPALQTLAGNTGTVNFGFQALNATQCIGSITGANGGAFTSGTTLCNGAACNGTVSAPASFTNASTTTNAVYNVAVTCTGAGSPATSTATITVPFTISHTTPGCTNPPVIASANTVVANFSRLTGNLSVSYFGGGFSTVDVTSFGSIYQTSNPVSYDWPGAKNSIPDFSLPTNKYISAEFLVPPGYMAGAPAGIYGEYVVGESGYSAPVSMTISTQCGDFSDPANYPASSVVPGCLANMAPADSFIAWQKSGSCALTDGTTYFLNIVNADIRLVQPNGGGTAKSTSKNNFNTICSGACSVPIQNGPGSWQTYTPH
jgi:hypothetical protein